MFHIDSLGSLKAIRDLLSSQDSARDESEMRSTAIDTCYRNTTKPIHRSVSILMRVSPGQPPTLQQMLIVQEKQQGRTQGGVGVLELKPSLERDILQKLFYKASV